MGSRESRPKMVDRGQFEPFLLLVEDLKSKMRKSIRVGQEMPLGQKKSL